MRYAQYIAWLSDGDGAILALATFNGELVAGGTFTQLGSATVNRIARWGCTPPPCPADADGNGAIQPADIAHFVTIWNAGLTGGVVAGDFDQNGAVEAADISQYVSAWFSALGNGC